MRKADNLAIFTCRLPRNPGNLKLLESSGPILAWTGLYLYLSPLEGRGSKSSSRLWLATLPPNETTYYFDNCTHLGYYAENSGNSLPTLRDNIFDPSLKEKIQK